MEEIIKKIISNVLTALYEPFGFALIITVLFMFLYLFAQEYGWKKIMKRWIEAFKTNTTFRRVCILTFYVAMLLFRTLLNRNLWMNPLSNVFGVWGFYDENGNITTQVVENIVLFIPLTILVMWCFQDKLIRKTLKVITILWQSLVLAFLSSLMIEFLQLMLRLGTFQLSDLCFNTLGGLIGGVLYCLGYKLMRRNDNQ